MAWLGVGYHILAYTICTPSVHRSYTIRTRSVHHAYTIAALELLPISCHSRIDAVGREVPTAPLPKGEGWGEWEDHLLPSSYGLAVGRYFAITISIVSSRLCGASSSWSTGGVAVGVSSDAAGWSVTVSLVLWNLTLTILLTPCSCIVMP